MPFIEALRQLSFSVGKFAFFDIYCFCLWDPLFSFVCLSLHMLTCGDILLMRRIKISGSIFYKHVSIIEFRFLAKYLLEKSLNLIVADISMKLSKSELSVNVNHPYFSSVPEL